MGKFSKTLAKGTQHREAPKRESSWLDPENNTESLIDFAEYETGTHANLPTDVPIGKLDDRLFKAVNKDASLPEIFKVIRTRILYPTKKTKEIKTVMITSAVPKEGKSFITANLGISLAQDMDQHSLLVDCDLRRPSLARLLGVSNLTGLVDYLREDLDLPDLISRTGTDKLSILPSGKPPLNPAELLSSARMKNLVNELSKRYDDRVIIFDSPPVMAAAETGVLSGLVDGVILVVREGVSKKSQIQKTIDTLGKEKILGMVYNDQTQNIFDRSNASNYEYYRHDEPNNTP